MMKERKKVMPAIAKIRFTNVVYENRQKRYNDETFIFDGHNGAVLLENGGGKTVFVQTLLQAIIPHLSLANRKAKDTFYLAQSACHIAIEWILQDSPRLYGLTAVTLYLRNDELKSYKYTYRYEGAEQGGILDLPFTREDITGKKRPATAEEMHEYYLNMHQKSMNARMFDQIQEYSQYLEQEFKIIEEEWRSLAVINTGEGDVAKFFESCKTTKDLVSRLLIPTVLRALQVNQKITFPELFEQKRNHFKKYKQLKEQIEETDQISKALAKVMAIYEKQHETKGQYEVLQKQAKAYYNEVLQKSQDMDEQIEELVAKQNNLEQQEFLGQQMAQSLAIATRQDEEIRCRNHHDELLLYYEQIKVHKQQLEQARNKLCYLRDRLKRDEKRFQITEAQTLLQRKSHQLEVREVETELQQVYEKLHFLYDQKAAEFNQQLQLFLKDIQKADVERKHLKNQQEKQNKTVQELTKQQAQAQTRLERIQQEQERIAQKILANWQEQQVSEELVRWIKSCEYIQNSMAQQVTLRNRAEKEKRDLLQQSQALQEEKQIKRLDVQKYSSDLERSESLQEAWRDKVRTVPGLHSIQSVYVEQGKIEALLNVTIRRTEQEVQEAWLQERRDFRLVDCYGEQEQFFFDPSLQGFLDNTSFIVESGTAYLVRLVDSGLSNLSEQLEKFPWWPFCIVTIESERDRVVNKLRLLQDQFTAPIFILTREEARQLAEGNGTGNTLYPDFWPKVLERTTFSQWQVEMKRIADQSQAERKGKEEFLNKVAALKSGFNDFQEQYPLSFYQRIKEEKQKATEQLEQAELRLQATGQALRKADKVWQESQEELRNLEGQQRELNYKIVSAQEWLSKEREKKEVLQSLMLCENQFRQAQQEAERINLEIDFLEQKKEQLHDQARKWDHLLNRLQGEELYQKLQNYDAVESGQTESALKAKQRTLLLQLNKIQIERESVEEQIKQLEQEEQEFTTRLKEYSVSVSEEDRFPTDGQVQLECLYDEIKEAVRQFEITEDSYHEAKQTWVTAQTRFQDAKTRYITQFDQEPHVFTEPFDAVETRLNQEKVQRMKEIALVKQGLSQLEEQQKVWQELKLELEKQNGKYEFLTENVQKMNFDSEQSQSFPYQGRQMVQQLLSQLQQVHEELNRKDQAVTEAKLQFEEFYNASSFKDEKMRQRVLDGIRRNQSYEEMIEMYTFYQKVMASSRNMAEQQMQEFHKDLELFVHHLQVHLLSICDEIRVIQKMTNIKVEDQWKSLYEIKTPVWEEGQAQERLIRHVEWMTEKLSSESYLQEDGLDDLKKIRRQIENWLSPAFLFQIISPTKLFFVGVRKVANDNRVHHHPVDWATSNNWSGGEKWSKNMALFLGIQSYLAEKLQPTKRSQGNSRVVVLDNPFGQASSDHVLEPVFFIAEKLGYQVIALTALAEGKFLRDYFPVIYSCRLRLASSGDTEIMDKELQINYAYFEDKAPQSLSRLGQVRPAEQLGLALI